MQFFFKKNRQTALWDNLNLLFKTGLAILRKSLLNSSALRDEIIEKQCINGFENIKLDYDSLIKGGVT